MTTQEWLEHIDKMLLAAIEAEEKKQAKNETKCKYYNGMSELS